MSTNRMDENQPLAVQITDEERRAMESCMSRAKWTKTMPMAMIGSGLKFYMDVKVKGKPPRIAPIMGVGMLFGISTHITSLYGCVSEVATKCPDGTLANHLLNKRQREMMAGGSMQGSSFEVPESIPAAAQPKAPNFLDLDTQVPEFKGLDESGYSDEDDMKPKPGPNQTYDELRRRNRESGQYAGVQGQRGIPTPDAVPSYIEPQISQIPYSTQAPQSAPSEPKKRQKVNQYGDVWDE